MLGSGGSGVLAVVIVIGGESRDVLGEEVFPAGRGLDAAGGRDGAAGEDPVAGCVGNGETLTKY